ncbi:hypothetical protein HHK36_001119 [Tetracentron sinense]|uniref:Uncharacterized protein n=1 Tax=Tetracentron sinense TaxID=13715 RepID=A0A835DQP3_TETSI|nr:hypothetical protein HHK36_001119 [Tetracentron sinense]
MAFSGTLQKCKACDKTLYVVDLLSADGVAYHKSCFKCSHCRGTLVMSNYSSMDGVLYCKPHFEQLFKETGSFKKNFQSAGKTSGRLNELVKEDGGWSLFHALNEVTAIEYEKFYSEKEKEKPDSPSFATAGQQMEKKRKSTSPVLKREDTPLISKRPRTKTTTITKITIKIGMDSDPIIWERTPSLETPKSKKMTKKGASCSNPVPPKKPKTKKKKKKTTKKKGASCSSDPAPQMPENLMNELERMGATEITYLMQKKLFDTDISKGHNRLSIPTSQVDGRDFLTKKEKKTVQKKKDGVLEVVVVDPMAGHWTLNFTQWKMKSSNIYALIKQWKQLVKANNLCVGDTILLWSFRCDSKLCFVLNVVRDADNGVLPSSDIATTTHSHAED